MLFISQSTSKIDGKLWKKQSEMKSKFIFKINNLPFWILTNGNTIFKKDNVKQENNRKEALIFLNKESQF
jgi:hypothetical protein